jgi:hypothetical protein
MHQRLKIFFVLCFIVACTGYIPPKHNLTKYLNSEKSYDLEFYWNLDKKLSQIYINGLIKNVRYYDIRSFLLNVELFDDEGNIISKGIFDYRHDIIKPDETIPFSVNLIYSSENKLKKIKFSYRYYFTEDNKFNNDFIFWSFEREIL